MKALKNKRAKLPVWLDTIEKVVRTNINDSLTFNPYMYNKKLEGVDGSIETVPPSKNLVTVACEGRTIDPGKSVTWLELIKLKIKEDGNTKK